MEEKWFKRSFRRNLVDMHIPDWDEKFLSELDAKEYADTVAKANIDTAEVYANSHVGHCYWPTKSGHMHEGLKGRDILGEIVNLLHKRGINVVIYYSLIFNNWAYDNHPDWRIITAEGKGGKGLGRERYGVCCPNNKSYRDFTRAQLEELCTGYVFEGFWLDMTFWPTICYCPACKRRYASEVGGDLPKIINWDDSKWLQFQRKREGWLADFGIFATSCAKEFKPDVTVTHQSAAFIRDWKWGASTELTKASDYMSKDFFGGPLEQSFFTKLFYSLSEDTPFEFMTSRCDSSLREHTVIKPKELLEVQTYASLANDAAFVFIDGIDPVGTLNKDVYKIMGDIFKNVEEYEKYPGGRFCQDVGIYLSYESNIGLEENGKKVSEVENSLDYSSPHFRAAQNAAKSLLDEHIPFGVLTRKNLKDLSSYQVIILSNVLALDEEEAKALRDFVASGGSLYASRYTSLFGSQGRRKDFLLSDLFGASFLDETKEKVTYIAPADKGKHVLSTYSIKHPLSVFSSQLKVRPREGAKVLATITLPYTDPKDPTRFASIHSNPPGIPTDYPSVVLNEYGKGKVVYSAADLETANQEAHRVVFTNLIKLLSQKPFSFQTDAPKPVEVTLFHQKDKKRYLINLLNFQAELPNIPVEGIKLKVRLHKKEPRRLIKLPEEKELAYEVKKEYVEFIAPKLETFLILALDYR